MESKRRLCWKGKVCYILLHCEIKCFVNIEVSPYLSDKIPWYGMVIVPCIEAIWLACQILSYTTPLYCLCTSEMTILVEGTRWLCAILCFFSQTKIYIRGIWKMTKLAPVSCHLSCFPLRHPHFSAIEVYYLALT